MFICVCMVLQGVFLCFWVIFDFFRYVDTPYAPAGVDKYLKNCLNNAQKCKKILKTVVIYWQIDPSWPKKKFGAPFLFYWMPFAFKLTTPKEFWKKNEKCKFQKPKTVKKRSKTHLVPVGFTRYSVEIGWFFERFWLLKFAIFIFFSKFLRDRQFQGK